MGRNRYSSYATNIVTCTHNVCAWKLRILKQMFHRPRGLVLDGKNTSLLPPVNPPQCYTAMPW